MHVVDMIYHWAYTVPHRPAIIQPEMVTTFQGLADAIESIGERLDRLNLNKHEPVAVCIANPSFKLATVFALLHRGYSVASVNFALYPLLPGAGVRNLIYDTQGQVTSGGRNVRFDMSWLPSAQAAAPTRGYRKRPIENPSLIFFTSGTTGLPKKAVQPAAAIEQRLRHSAYLYGAHQKILIMPPTTSAFGLYRFFDVLSLGRTVYFAPDYVAVLSLINLFGVEFIIASPADALRLAATKIENPGYRMDSLKAITVGASPITSEGLASIRTALCRNVIHSYGTTETGVVGDTPFDVLTEAKGIRPFPWVELEIVDEADQPLPAGAEGFVRVRTPLFIETLKTVGPGKVSGARDGWYYSGDIGSLTEEGIFHLVGRSYDVFTRGGVKVSGSLIETILQGMPEVREAAACSVVGPSGREEIWIAVVANGEVDVERIKQRLSNHHDIGIPPDEVFVVDHLPRGDLGKVQKFRLRELLLGLKKGA